MNNLPVSSQEEDPLEIAFLSINFKFENKTEGVIETRVNSNVEKKNDPKVHLFLKTLLYKGKNFVLHYFHSFYPHDVLPATLPYFNLHFP